MSNRLSVPYRRKREGRTNYKKRLALLKSGKPRFVIRKTNKYIITQVAGYDNDGDRIICSAHSKELAKYGWPYSGKNMPAAYLTGYLLGLRAKEKANDGIIDLGLHTSKHGSRIYAVVKGIKDAGVHIHTSEDVFPDEKRIAGEHIKTHATKAKGKQYSTYKDTDKITATIDTVKKKLEQNGTK